MPGSSRIGGSIRCPVIPMKLLLLRTQGTEFELLSLAADGSVTVPLSPDQGSSFRIDGRGCLLTKGGVEVEFTPEGDVWTLHSIIRVRRPGELLGEGDVELGADGVVAMMTFDADRREIARIEGYRPEGRCAALLLVGTFLLMMPSMAVADGVAPILDPPAGSRCLDLPRNAPHREDVDWDRHDAHRECRPAIARFPEQPAPPCSVLHMCANEAPLTAAEHDKLLEMIHSVSGCPLP